MFVSKDEIIEKVDEIISDGKDNEIVFIVASKGIGKTRLLNEIRTYESHRKDMIIADGNRIRGSSSVLTKCFIDGICSFIEMNDPEMCINEIINYLPNTLKTNSIIEYGKINIARLSVLLSSLSLSQLKDLFVQLAEDTPLVLIASSLFLNPVDVEYLESLYFDKWSAKVTFVIALRPTPDCVKALRCIAKRNENRTWVFPLLPKIVKNSLSLYPMSIASIHVDDIGDSDSGAFTDTLLSNDAFFDTYHFYGELLSDDFRFTRLLFFANQEIRICDSKYLSDIVKNIYGNTCYITENEDHLILPHNGKLLWIDALSYFLAINGGGITKAIAETQEFFFYIINNVDQFTFGQPERKSLVSFLNDLSLQKPNVLASGFSIYFSSFASLVKMISIKKRRQNVKRVSPELITILLERLVLDLSDSCTEALLKIYDNTQSCSILDVGLEIIFHFISQPTAIKINSSIYQQILEFINICAQEAKKWHDETLDLGVAKLRKALEGNKYKIIIEECENKNKADIYNESIICELIQRALLSILNNIKSSMLLENDLNDLLRDFLCMVYVNIKDQTRRGISKSGRSVGSLDILICNQIGTAVALIEPLRLTIFNRDSFLSHVDKTLKNYNPDGCKICCTIIYSFYKDFSTLWENAFRCLSNYIYPFEVGKQPEDIDTGVTELRHAKVVLIRSGQPLAFHLYSINLYQQQIQSLR